MVRLDAEYADGRIGLKYDRIGLARALWSEWSPSWDAPARDAAIDGCGAFVRWRRLDSRRVVGIPDEHYEGRNGPGTRFTARAIERTIDYEMPDEIVLGDDDGVEKSPLTPQRWPLFSCRGERQAPAWHRPFPTPRIARSRRIRCNGRLTEAGSHGRKRRLLRASFNMPRTPPNSIHPKTRAEWREWLEHHQTQTEGVWLISFKKASGNPRLSYDEAVEEALCFGWVDSKLNRLDAERSMLCFAPRKAGTGWSRLNKTRVEKLMIAGRMRPTGLAKVEAARQDGSWYAMDSIEAIEFPPDLDKALTANRTAHQYFNAFPRSVKRAILEWITSAKKAETRAKRIEETVNSAAKNIRANQWRQHKVNRA